MTQSQIIAEVIKNGLVQGAFLALLAWGFSLVYRSTGVFHIAQGSCFLAAGYAAYFVGVRAGDMFWPACGSAVAVAALAGIAVDTRLYRPLQARGASAAVALVSSLAVLMVTEGVLNLVVGSQIRSVPSQITPGTYVLGILITSTDVLYVLTAGICCAVLAIVLSRTRLGLAIRACASNPALLQTLGKNPYHPRSVAVAIGSILVGIAASYQVFRGGIDPASAWPATIAAAVAAILGGKSLLYGPGLAAVLIGIARSVTTLLLSDQWADSISYALLLLIVVVRPEGLAPSGVRTQ